MTDVAVIGAGLLGSATARHLAERGANVTLYGPDVTGSTRGPLRASHHDVSRIVRPSGHDALWSQVNRRSMEGLQALGPSVFRPVGCATGCRVKRPETSSGAADGHPTTWGTQGVGPWRFDGPVVWEPTGGLLQPIALARAQQDRFTSAGGTWVRQRVFATPDGFETREGRIDADTVVVAAGAWSGELLGMPERVRIKTETTWLAHVPARWLREHDTAPGWIDDATGDGWSGRYAVGPQRYPDGGVYVKIGADLATDADLTAEQIERWFDQGFRGTPDPATVLRAALEDLWPGLGERPGRIKRCMVTYGAEHPYIDEVRPGVWWVGPGNGYAAMASDGLGQIAADRLHGCPDGLPEGALRWVKTPPG